jgi:flagellar biosynthesis protein
MIMNKIHLGPQDEKKPQEITAAALGYDPVKDAAPRLLASGSGRVAQQIIDIANANGIPLREDPILAAALSQIDVNEEIPQELYSVVAEVFAYIYRIREKRMNG